jgi:hypothetical protein
MKSVIKIIALFLVVGLVSCGGSSEDETPVVVNIKIPGKATLASPVNGATCEPGANITPTQSNQFKHSRNDNSNRDYIDQCNSNIKSWNSVFLDLDFKKQRGHNHCK